MSKKRQTKHNTTKNQKCLYCKKWFDESEEKEKYQTIQKAIKK